MQPIESVTQHIQDSIIHLGIVDTDFLAIVRPMDMSQVFPSSIPLNCWKICCDYFDHFGKAPQDHFHDEVAVWINKLTKEDKVYIVDYIQKIQKLTPDKKYVLLRLNNFVKQRRLEKALIDAAEVVEKNYGKASEILYSALDRSIEEMEAGLDYLYDYSGIKDRYQLSESRIKTGIGDLDRLIGGLDRGRLVCIMGAFKGKKSWSLIHFGKHAVLQGLKVLHITHELSREETEARYDMAFGALVDGKEGPKKHPTDLDDFMKKWEVESSYLEDGAVKYNTIIRPTIYDLNEVQKIRNRVKGFGGKLRIRKFPAGSCTMEDMLGYIHYLEKFKGFHPDVIINDYVEKMNLGTKDELRHRINDVYLAHKRLADELNVLVITASQVIRSAIRSSKIRKEHFAEDIQKAGNVDLALAVCQSEEEISLERGKIYVVANRTGAEDVWCQIGMNINIGQFALWSRPSWMASQEIMDSVEDEREALLETRK